MMRKNSIKSPMATFMAFTTLAFVWKWTKKMIKKYHLKHE